MTIPNPDPRVREVAERLRMEAESRITVDVANHASDRVHEIIKMHGMTMPSVGQAVAFGLIVARSILADTLEFGIRSMDGDPDDEAAFKAGASILWHELASGVAHLQGTDHD